MDRLHNRQNNIEIVQFIATALKSIPKLVEMQSLVAKCCNVKCARYEYDPIKIADVVYFSITHGKLIPLWIKGYQFCVRGWLMKTSTSELGLKQHQTLSFSYQSLSTLSIPMKIRPSTSLQITLVLRVR